MPEVSGEAGWRGTGLPSRLPMAGSERTCTAGRRLKPGHRANLGVEGWRSVPAGGTPEHKVTLHLNLHR